MPLLLLMIVLLLLMLLRSDSDRSDLLLLQRCGERISGATSKEMMRNRGTSEQLIIGGCRTSTRGAETLHALEIQPILLEMAGDVLARKPVNAHQLHYCLGHGVLDAEMSDSVDEALVELGSPDEARALEGASGLVGAVGAGHGEIGSVEIGLWSSGHRRRRE